MSFDFAPAEPVKRAAVGRAKDPNPFLDAVKSIAWKNDEKTGKAAALSFTVPLRSNEPKHEDNVALRRIHRQLSEAGDMIEPVGTVLRDVSEPVDGKSVVTFWVGVKQYRTRKSVEDSAKDESVNVPAEAEVKPKGSRTAK